jgi:hypothetical protein
LRLFVGITATLGLLAAVLVHGATYAGVDVLQRYPEASLLHLGCFVVFIPLLFSLWSDNRLGGRIDEMFTDHPRWVLWLLIAVAIYAAVNFVLFFLLTGGGTAEMRNGEFVLLSHGKLIRHLTEAEYHLQRIYVARGFSGHWLVFYLFPALYFLVPLAPKRPSGSLG